MNTGQFKKGFIPWNKGLTKEICPSLALSNETREKLSKKLKGRIVSEETKRKMSIAQKGKKLSKETRELISIARKGQWKDSVFRNKMMTTFTSQEFRNKISGLTMLRYKTDPTKNPMYGKTHSKQARLKISIGNKGHSKSIEAKKKMSSSAKLTWVGPNREKKIQRLLERLRKRPTSYENKIIELIKKYRLPFSYVGNGAILINYRNPDFIHNNGKKLLIEVGSHYFRDRNRGERNYEEERSKWFAKYGFKTLFLWDEDLFGESWESCCLDKIQGFEGIPI